MKPPETAYCGGQWPTLATHPRAIPAIYRSATLRPAPGCSPASHICILQLSFRILSQVLQRFEEHSVNSDSCPPVVPAFLVSCGSRTLRGYVDGRVNWRRGDFSAVAKDTAAPEDRHGDETDPIHLYYRLRPLSIRGNYIASQIRS